MTTPEHGTAIALSAILTAGGTLSVLPVAAHEFTDPAGPATDAQMFPAGARVAVWSPDMTTKRGAATMSAIGEASLTLSAVLTVAPGDIVVLDDYSTQPDAVRERYSFLIDDDGQAEEVSP